MAQIEDIVAAAPEGFEVLSGDDAITFELISIGAVGVISVIGNAYPADFGKWCMPNYRVISPLHCTFTAI